MLIEQVCVQRVDVLKIVLPVSSQRCVNSVDKVIVHRQNKGVSPHHDERVAHFHGKCGFSRGGWSTDHDQLDFVGCRGGRSDNDLLLFQVL